MKKYNVKWETQVFAETPLHAAKKALEIQQDKTSKQLNFDVTQIDCDVRDRELFEIDLNIGDDEGVR